MYLGGGTEGAPCTRTSDFWCSTNWRIENDAFGCPTWRYDVRAIDAANNVYVADRDNKRIQVFDTEGNFKTQFRNVGSPCAICITPGARQFLYVSNSNPPNNLDYDGEILKMTLDGRIVGKFGRAGKLLKEFGTVNAIDCRTENELYVGELGNWRVQKVTLKPTAAGTR